MDCIDMTAQVVLTFIDIEGAKGNFDGGGI